MGNLYNSMEQYNIEIRTRANIFLIDTSTVKDRSHIKECVTANDHP